MALHGSFGTVELEKIAETTFSTRIGSVGPCCRMDRPSIVNSVLTRTGEGSQTVEKPRFLFFQLIQGPRTACFSAEGEGSKHPAASIFIEGILEVAGESSWNGSSFTFVDTELAEHPHDVHWIPKATVRILTGFLGENRCEGASKSTLLLLHSSVLREHRIGFGFPFGKIRYG